MIRDKRERCQTVAMRSWGARGLALPEGLRWVAAVAIAIRIVSIWGWGAVQGVDIP